MRMAQDVGRCASESREPYFSRSLIMIGSKRKNACAVCAACLSVLYLALLFHSQFSFSQSDESFYSALVHRLWLGDRMILSEWHPVQFYTPLLLPLYSLYRLLVPSGDGVILFMRILTITFSWLVSLLLFAHLSGKYPPVPSALSACLCLLYSRANIAGPSYYNLFALFIVLFAVCLSASASPAPSHLPKPVLSFLSGCCFSMGVLCNPYAVLLLLLLPVFLLWLRPKQFLRHFLSGILVCAVLYLLYAMDFSSLDSYLKNILYVPSDPEHLGSLSSKWVTLMAHFRSMVYWFFLAIVLGFSALLLWGKPRMSPAFFSLLHLAYLFACLVYFFMFILLGVHRKPCFTILLLFSTSALPDFLVSVQSRRHEPAALLYVLGFGVSIVFFLSSNTGLDAMSVGFCVSSMGAMLLLGPTFEAFRPFGSRVRALCRAVLCTLLLITLTLCAAHRFLGIYRDASLPRLDTRLQSGPAKGLLTTQDHARQYESILCTIEEVEAQVPDAAVLHSKRAPWAYLCTDWTYGTPTAWTTDLSSERLPAYYTLHPDRQPTLVFLYSPDVGHFEAAPFNNHVWSPQFNTNTLSGLFYDLIVSSGTIIAQTDYVTVYRIP